MKVLKILLISFLICVIFAIGGAFWLYTWAAKDLPGFKNVTDYKPSLVTTVYAKDNQVLGYFYKEKRFLVTLDQMSPWLPKTRPSTSMTVLTLWPLPAHSLPT